MIAQPPSLAGLHRKCQHGRSSDLSMLHSCLKTMTLPKAELSRSSFMNTSLSLFPRHMLRNLLTANAANLETEIQIDE